MKNLLYLLVGLIAIAQLNACKTTKKHQRKYLNNFYHELKDSFPNAEVTLLKDSIKVIFPDDIMFEIGSHSLKDTCFPNMLRLAQLVNKYNKTNLLITGHTDNTGQEVENEKLSKTRAENVKLNLVENKVIAERLFVWGFGARTPRDTNETDKGRARNRRVEFVVLYHENDN